MAADISAKLGIDGEKAFRDSLEAINSQLKTMGSEMKSVVSAFAGMEDSEKSLSAKSDVLQRSIALSGEKIQLLQGQSDRAKTKLSTLSDKLEDANNKFGENSKQVLNAQNAYNRQVVTANMLESQIFNTTTEMNNMQTEMKQLHGSTEQLSDGFENTEKKAFNFASIIKGSAATIGTFAVQAGVAAIGIGKEAGAAAISIGKEAVAAYAGYEQLAGGVDTLFKGSSGELQQYAVNAYKTSGMSATDYMEAVTSFSASLIQSLGGDTEKAVEYADMAITDMSDNASNMGTDMASIQSAYQGFAKQNYTMLDNLKLGYGGTKEEMQRLLEDAQNISGIKYDISSYADVVDAIHVMQESMGIAGSTAFEAEKTISGSISSLQIAVQNLLVGFGDSNADMSTLTQNFADALQNAITNILPVIENMVSALPEVVAAIIPALEGMLPSLLSAVTELLKQMVDAIFIVLPQLIPAALSGVMMIVDTLFDNIPLLINAASELIKELGNGLVNAIPELVPKIVDVVIGIVNTIIENLPMIIEAGVEIIVALAGAIIESIPTLIKAIPIIISSLNDAFDELIGKMKEIGKNVIEGLWSGIGDNVDSLRGKVSGIVDKIKGWFTNKDGFDTHSPSKWSEKVMSWVMQGMAVGVEKTKNVAITAAKNATNDVKEVFTDTAKDIQKSSQDVATAVENMRNKLSEYGSLTEMVETEDGSVFKLSNLQDDIDAIEKYGQALADVKAKGISDGLFGEITDMNIDDAMKYMGELLSMTDAGLTDYVALYDKKQKAAEEVANKFYGIREQVLESLADDVQVNSEVIGTDITAAVSTAVVDASATTSTMAQIVSGMQTQEPVLTDYITVLNEKLLSLAIGFKGDYIDIGKMMMDGVSEGIENGQSGLINTITSVLRAAVNAAREEMDINSPSGVFEEIGDYMGQGLDVGWTGRIKSVTENIRNSMADIAKPSAMSLLGAGGGNVSNSYSYGGVSLFIDTVNNGNGRDTQIMANELEFVRRRKVSAKGGKR